MDDPKGAKLKRKPGGGRKPAGPVARTELFSIRVTPKVKAWLDSRSIEENFVMLCDACSRDYYLAEKEEESGGD